MSDATKSIMLRKFNVDTWRRIRALALEEGVPAAEILGAAAERYLLSKHDSDEWIRKAWKERTPCPAALDSVQEEKYTLVELDPLKAAPVPVEAPAGIINVTPVRICGKPLGMTVGHVCQLPAGHEGKCPKEKK